MWVEFPIVGLIKRLDLYAQVSENVIGNYQAELRLTPVS